MGEYHVAPDGSDVSGSGTEASPWATPQKAADTLEPGDIVFVKNGIYRFVDIIRSGLPEAWMEFKAYPGHAPHIHAAGGTQRAIRVNGGNYIIIDGFEATTESDIGIGVQFNNCHHGIARNCIVRDNGESGLVARECDWIILEKNVSFGNSRRSGYQGSGINLWRVSQYEAGEGFHYIVRGNLVYDNINLVGVHSDGNGIIVDNSRGIPPVLIENNVCFDNGGRGVNIYNSDNVTTRNNTLYRNKKDPAHTGAGELLVHGDNCEVYNNIIYSDGQPTTYVWQATNYYFDFNLHWGGSPQVSGPNDITVDPLFVNPSVDPTVADFHLLARSPAIEAGRNGEDLGAYGYVENGGQMVILRDGERYTFADLEPGVYRASGLVPEGWTLAQNDFQITLAEGDQVTVVFLYTQLIGVGSIIVAVETTPSGAAQEFEIIVVKTS